ncbi:hypothetical protein BDV18DRAFT_129390 [Aspergillus unguis]
MDKLVIAHQWTLGQTLNANWGLSLTATCRPQRFLGGESDTSIKAFADFCLLSFRILRLVFLCHATFRMAVVVPGVVLGSR